jgi:CRP/FNR family transcriptional regulator
MPATETAPLGAATQDLRFARAFRASRHLLQRARGRDCRQSLRGARVAPRRRVQPGILSTLRASRLFSVVDDALLTRLAEASRRTRLVRGDVLWRTGEPCTRLAVIASGLLKLCQPERGAGPCAILAIFGPRESVGDIAIACDIDYPADAIAASESVEVLCIEKRAVKDAVEHSARLAQALHRSIGEHMLQLRSKIRIMTAGPADRRLATLLFHLNERFGDELEDGTLAIPVVLSRVELASLVGTTVETTIRCMSRWQKSGILDTTSDGFVLRDAARLRCVIDGAEATAALAAE